MKRPCRLVLIWLLTVSCVSGTRALAAPSSPRGSAREEIQDTTDGWARDNYDLVLDVVFQDSCAASKEPGEVRWIACVRIVPGYPTELEYGLSVEKSYGGTVSAHVTRPRAESIYTQLCRLKKEHPAASASNLARFIELETQAGDQQRFPALLRFADEFEKIRFSPVLPDELLMDATRYVFCSKSSSGNQMELVLRGPGSSAPRQPQPLLQWVESVRQMLASSFK
jgi:hypothetical protein